MTTFDSTVELDMLTLREEHAELGALINNPEVGWENLDAAQKRRYVRLSVEISYVQQYDSALEYFSRTGPQWHELTDEQRQTVRENCKKHAKEMQEFGNSLSAK